jgi:diacylglycerol kinase family enzyme
MDFPFICEIHESKSFAADQSSRSAGRSHANRGDRAAAISWPTVNDKDIPHPTELPDLIRRYSDRVDLIVIGGGDGTLNAAADGLVDIQLPLGILPLGTANDLARTLGLPKTLSGACGVIAQGRRQAIDLGWVNGKHFFNVASLGLSVKITQQLSKKRSALGRAGLRVSGVAGNLQISPLHG